jgi:hypothetical protein
MTCTRVRFTSHSLTSMEQEVARVAEGGLADRAGVKVGWALAAINGKSLAGIPQPQVHAHQTCPTHPSLVYV